MKTPVSKSVLVIVGLGLALSALVVWFGLHSRKSTAMEVAPIVAQNSDAPAVPKFLSAPATKKLPTAPAAEVADNSLLPVIPISLVKLLSADAAYTGSAMGSLPSGTQKFGGVEFWLQGIIRLQGTGTRDFESSHFRTNVVVPLDETNEVNGQLVVNERGKNISAAYLVGGSLYSSDKSHEKIADVIWHYDDDTRSSPLEANLHLRDWVRQTYEEPARLPNPLTKVAWHGPHPSRKDVTLRLYRVGFVNPYPEKIVRSLEFVSAMKRPSLFIAALTLDPLLPGARPDNLTSDEFADPELGGLLQLFVQDPDGHAVAGADVRSGFNAWNKGSPARHTITDASGLASVHFDPGADTLEVNAEADGFSGRMMLWSMKEGDKVPANYTLKLTAEMKFGGIVVNQENVPVAGASVTVSRFWRGPVENGKGEQSSFSRQALTTDTEGRWQAKGVSPKLLDNIGFSVSHPEYVTANPVSGVNGTVEQQLRAGTHKTILQRGAMVKGRVVDGAGSAVPAATVWAGRKYSRERQQTTADAEGKFSFRNLPDGEQPFTAMGKGFAPAMKMATVATDMAEIVIRVSPGKILKGHVQDESAQPVASARISLENNYDSEFSGLEFSASTDANGDFTWDSAPDAELPFYAGHEGFEAKRNIKLKPGGENIITLRRSRTLTGVVLDAATGNAVTNFSVRTGTTSEGNPDQVYGAIRDKNFSAPDGRFTMTLSEEADNAVLVTAGGYESKVEKFAPGDSSGVQVTVRLKVATQLEGVVLAPDGTPAPGVTVGAAPENSRGGNVSLTGGRLRTYDSRIKIATTDDQGHFKLASAPDKGLVVAAGEAGFARVPVEQLKGNTTIRLEAWGRIEGTLKIGGEPGVGKDLIFTMQIPGIGTDFNAYKSTTDAQGKFTIEKVPPGEGAIERLIKTSANSSSYSDNTTVQVKAGETTKVSLGDNGAVIAGRYRYTFQLTNEPPLHIEAQLNSQMPTMPKFNSSAEAQAFFNTPEWKAAAKQQKNYALELLPNGGFTADNVAPGNYSLTITVRPGGNNPWSKPPIAEGHSEVTVPDSFNPAQPIDAGEVLLEPRQNQQP